MDKFKTHYNLKQFTRNPEIPWGEKLVETAGYIPAKQRIENLILAGQRLAQSRAEMYDFQDGEEIDENFIDPTRKKSYDMAEAFQASESLKMKRDQSLKERNAQIKRAHSETKSIPQPPNTETEVK